MIDNHITKALDTGKYFTPYLARWLKKKYWSAKQGLLLLTGNDPISSSGVSWESSDGLFCGVNQVAILGWEDHPASFYALHTREDLEKMVRECNREAQQAYNKVSDELETFRALHQESLRASGEHSPEELRELAVDRMPTECLPGLPEHRDNECYDACMEQLWWRRNSERLLSKFIEYWLDIPRGLDEEGIEVSFFLEWVFRTCLSDDVLWWRDEIINEAIPDQLLLPSEHRLVEEDQVESGYLNQKELRAFFDPAVWNTIKTWATDYGIPQPSKGDRWPINQETATKIKADHLLYFETKKKNRKK